MGYFDRRMRPYTSESQPTCVRDKLAGAEVLFSLAQGEARAIADRFETSPRVAFARSLCSEVLAAWWRRSAGTMACAWDIRAFVTPPVKGHHELTTRLGDFLATLPGPRAGYLAGQLYTTLLPDSMRKEMGAYYTPPPLVDRLIEMVTEASFDWKRGRVIDPACGGAAFLAAVAPRLVAGASKRAPEAVLEDIETRLAGIELDPFAAWMAMVLLDLELLPTTIKAGRRLKSLVSAGDALAAQPLESGTYDLVIGNPPYGRVTLPAALRTRFRESLFGHANLYGLFTNLGVQLAREGGLVAYVTPTSFLGGEYFKRLRQLLSVQAPLQQAAFVRDREGVFAGVLQETMLTVFRRGTNTVPAPVAVSALHTTDQTEPLPSQSIGTVTLHDRSGGPWVLPRTREQALLVRQLNAMPRRLIDYGFAVSTGQLVWNRHKDQLCAAGGHGCYPIIWAEAVGANGVFQFQAARRNHLPYLKAKPGQDFLINQEPCILVQRTTAKEQRRRLIAAVIPNSFVVAYPGFVVENHLNMVYPVTARPRVTLGTLVALLNSTAVDRAFRCINGSVAVSAYELNALPLPSLEQMQELDATLSNGGSREQLETQISDFYTSGTERHERTTARHPARQHREMVA